VKPGNRQPEAEPSIDVYRVIHRSALYLCLRFEAREAWPLWTVAAGLRRWAAAQAGATKTLAIAHATDGDTYRDRGLRRQARRHYETSLNLLIPLEGDRTVEQVRERLAEVDPAGPAGGGAVRDPTDPGLPIADGPPPADPPAAPPRASGASGPAGGMF
jgi:hypothetical protein